MKRFICSLTLLIGLAAWTHAQPVHIPDPNLRLVLQEALELPGGAPITRDAMLQLTRLDVKSRGVTDLTGLEFATNLTWLRLRKNRIADITPVGHLTNLIDLGASYCNISDISPLANLVKLETLSLYGNRITNVTPLANLTQLRWLRIESNLIADHSPLDRLMLDHFSHDLDAPCDMAPLPLAPRIEGRTFPSLFTAWSDKSRWPLFDLIFCCPRFDARLRQMGDGYQFRTDHSSWDGPISVRDAYLEANPTMVFLHGLSAIWSTLDTFPEDYPHWLRDENGEIVVKWGMYGLMDLADTGWQQRMIDIAATIDRCGLYDGIFIDGWSEYHSERRGRGQLAGQVAILKGIRERVRGNFLIMVNTNDWQAPASAPYINGLFMESGFPEKRTTPEAIERGLVKVENTLRWAEETLLEPRIIGLEGSDYRHESPHTPRNMRWMRATTTLGLTFSDGYVAFPLRGGPWYDFWDADLGRPVGEKEQLYQETEGLYIREYTNGWAVYNHSGAAQVVTLPEEVRSVASGLTNTEQAVLNLDGDIFLKLPPELPGDINGDGVVNILDLTLVAQAFGADASKGDVNGDGVVNVFDLVFVANRF